MMFVFYRTCSGEEICYSISSETTDTVIRSQALPFGSYFRSYTIFQFFLGKSKIQRICPFPALRTCLHRRNWCRSCSTAPSFAVLRVEEWRTRQWLVLCVQSVLWLVQLHTMNCSHDLVFWTVDYDWPHVFSCQWGTLLQCFGMIW